MGLPPVPWSQNPQKWLDFLGPVLWLSSGPSWMLIVKGLRRKDQRELLAEKTTSLREDNRDEKVAVLRKTWLIDFAPEPKFSNQQKQAKQKIICSSHFRINKLPNSNMLKFN